MKILLGIIITALSYLILPFLFFYKRINKYDNKTIKMMLIFNSIIISLLWILLDVAIYGNYQDINFAPAIFYYFINISFWNHNSNNNQQTEPAKNNNKLAIENEQQITEQKAHIKDEKNKNHSIKSTLIYSILVISVSINILLFVSVLLISNNTDKIKKEYDKLEKENSQMCKWHFHFTEGGIVRECDE